MLKPRDCRHEPPYPQHFTVMISLINPFLTAHVPTNLCPIEHPHRTDECGEWTEDILRA